MSSITVPTAPVAPTTADFPVIAELERTKDNCEENIDSVRSPATGYPTQADPEYAAI